MIAATVGGRGFELLIVARRGVAINVDRQQVGKRRVAIAAGVERFCAAQRDERAAAPRDELLDGFQLIEGEKGGFDRADDDGVIGEQFFFGFRKAARQLVAFLDALAIILAVRRAQHRGQHDVLLFGDGLAQLAVFPARLAFDVKNLRLRVEDFDEQFDGVVIFDRVVGRRRRVEHITMQSRRRRGECNARYAR